MIRKMSFLAVLLWLLMPSTPAFAQDQPSLGDVARQARKDREQNNAKPKIVVTEDTLPSSKGLAGLSLADSSGSQSSGSASALDRAMAKFAEAESSLKLLDGLDRPKLAKAVLMDNDVDFPNRRVWEDHLYAAKERYVSHERELVVEAKQLVTQAQSWKNSDSKLNPNDPRVQQMKQRMQEIIQDAIRTEDEYRSVVVQGWDLAKQTKP